MINQEKLKLLINIYLDKISSVGVSWHTKDDEGYKFKFVDYFQKHFDLEADDIAAMLQTIMDYKVNGQVNNLTYGSHYFPGWSIFELAKMEPDTVRSALRALFDEKKDVADRVDDFRDIMLKLMDQKNKRDGKSDDASIKCRFISLLLSSLLPDKYYAIKPTEYKLFIKEIDPEFEIPKKSSEGRRYKMIHEYCEEVNKVIKEMPEIKAIHELFVKDIDFKDKEWHWTTQDVIYISGSLLKEVKNGEEKNKEKSSKNKIKQNENEKEIEIEMAAKSKPIDLINFFNDTNFSNSPWVRHNPINHPEKISIRKLIDKCKPTFWMIPNFQRYFDWKKGYVKELWESIFKDYYIGSFLLLENRGEPKLGVLPIMGAEPKDKNPEMIILDGQQRITSIFYAVMAPDSEIFKTQKTDFYSKVYFYVNFNNLLANNSGADLIEIHSKEIEVNDSFNCFLFPLFKLHDNQRWITDFKDYCKQKINTADITDSEKGILIGKLDKLRDIIQDKLSHVWEKFEIPYVYLPDSMDLGQVADIFENINTKGKPLNVFDLLIARLYKYNIELRQLWESTLDKYPNIKRYNKKIDKMPIYIFQTLSLLYDKNSSTKKTDILNIYTNLYDNNKRDFQADWDDISNYIDQAIRKLELLNDGFGVIDEDSLPFAPIIPILAALLITVEGRNNRPACYKKIRQWYWASVFTNSYSSSVDSQLTSDFKELKLWFEEEDKIPKSVEEIRKYINSNFLNLIDIESWSNAQFRGIMALVAMEGAKDFNTEQGMMNVRENDKDHIFPRSMRLDHINSALNFTWLSKETNRKIKLAQKPSSYIPMFIEEKYDGDEKLFEETMSTHFIDQLAYNCLKSDDFDGFIGRRKELIIKKIKELVGCDLSVNEQLQEDTNEVLKKVEIGIRDSIDKVLQKNIGSNYWAQAIPQHIDIKVNSRLNAAQTAVPYATEINNPRKKLDYLDMTEYSDVILNKNNWIYFEKYFLNKDNTANNFKYLCDFRNPVKHIRDKQDVIDKFGEAAIMWLTGIINKISKD